ncbi:hypothetical protein [Dyadobacter sp. CY356]|uniref:hypothetical protein n=1 Tax=Dyadobacter sp. CY356 TaxID=2906442 RepID=UPI001F274413|nr:hypothetical protein [Dyadobacter sp. CY356]MCF0058407.1 hypothetical protein [Dyadobacter sp. CY356]
MDLEDNEFLKFVKAAYENDLEYLLIGGLALAMHGIHRYTSDADFWIKPTDDNKEKLIHTLVSLGYEEEEIHGIKDLDFTQAQIVRLEGPIDILTSVHLRMEFNECRQSKRIYFCNWI